MAKALILVGLILAQTATVSAQETRKSGNWTLTTTKNAFEGGASVVGVTEARQGVLALRCLRNRISFAWASVDETMKPKSIIDIKMRIDDRPVVESVGIVLEPAIAQIEAPKLILDDITKGKSLAIRMTIDGVMNDHSVSLRGAQQVVSAVRAACP